MTERTFRRIELGMSDAVGGADLGPPDFRVHGRIFATLQPSRNCGMVNVTPEQQLRLIREAPATFSPEAGAWGRQGCTRVHLEVADEEIVGEAMTLAWQKTVASRRARQKTKTAARPTRRKRA